MSSVCIYSWHILCLFAKLFHRHTWPILLTVKNKVFYWNCIFTFSFTLTQLLLVVVIHTHTLFVFQIAMATEVSSITCFYAAIALPLALCHSKRQTACQPML